MTEVLTSPSTTDAEAAPGCGCCKPPDPPSVGEQIAALEARQASVEQRLRSLQGD